MENRRAGGQKGDMYFSPEATRRRSFSKKPPRGSWQPTVLSWEKTFCKVVGSFDWETLLSMKKFVHLYDNVVKWDDSAGEEAFHNAKKRFLAEMQGRPCDVTLPDPDLYIDKVDWDSKVDSELLSELECRSPDMAENHEPVVIFGDTLLRSQGFSPFGWGDSEEDVKKATNSSSHHNNNSPLDQSACKSKESVKQNGWEDSSNNNAYVPDVGSGFMGDAGWDDNSRSWNNPNYQYLDQNCQRVPENGRTWGNWDGSYGKNVNAGRSMSRYKTTRFHGDEQHGSYPWRNGNGRKRVAFVPDSSNDQRWMNSNDQRWMNSCGPLSYHASGNPRQTWNLEKPVS